jgi:hypothetical protein
MPRCEIADLERFTAVSAMRPSAHRSSVYERGESLVGATLIRHEPTPDAALLVDELFSQDVCVPAMLG